MEESQTTIFCCENTGEKVCLPEVDYGDILKGQMRVFASAEVAEVHRQLEGDRCTFFVHRNAIYADPNRNIRRFSVTADQFIALMDSMRVEGILQPLLVQRSNKHLPALYELRAGFRRWEASKQVGIDLLPIVVVDDSVSPKIAGLLENVREDMKPLEMAAAISAIMDEGYINAKGKHKRMTQNQAAKMLGMSQSRINGLLALTEDLHSKVSAGVVEGTIPISKAVLLKQLPPQVQHDAMEFIDKLDTPGVRRYVQDKREELGIVSPQASRVKSKKVKKTSDRCYKLRSVTDIIPLCVLAEDDYFTRGITKKSAKVKVQLLQYILGLIDKPSDEPLPATIDKKLNGGKAVEASTGNGNGVAESKKSVKRVKKKVKVSSKVQATA